MKKIEKYYKDLYLKTERVELLDTTTFRRRVFQNINLRDENIKNILTTFTGLNNLQTLALFKNRKNLLEFIRTSALPQNQKKFLLNFEEDLNLFLPMGSGWGCASRDKDDSEKMQRMILEGLNGVTTMGLMLSVLIQTQANEMDRKKLEFSQHELLINRKLKEEEFELERERLELLKKQLESDITIHENDYSLD